MRLNLQTTGLDAIARDLQKMAGGGAMTSAMLQKGADVLKEEWKEEIAARGHVKTGDMISSVEKTTPKTGTDEKSISVYPQGVGRNGTRNAEKAFLLHYGWKTGGGRKAKRRKGASKGDHFVDAIKEKAEPKVVAAMEAVMDSYTK